MHKSVREYYVEQGVEGFYQDHGQDYKNPHEQRVKLALRNGLFKWKPQMTRVLDLACGSGEVTLILNELGVLNVDGMDPFTSKAYQLRTNKECLTTSFEDIVDGGLSDQKYSLIVCSYALHLAKESLLPVLCMQLALSGRALIILSPHKKPTLKSEWGWTLVEEIIVERTHVRYYTSSLFYEDQID